MAVLRRREHYGSVLPDPEDVAIADMPAKPASVRMGGIKQQRAVAFLRRQGAERIKRDLQVIGNPLHQTLRSPLTVGTAACTVAEHDPRQSPPHKACGAVLTRLSRHTMMLPAIVGG